VTKPLRIHHLAEDELADAASWYEVKQPGLGISLLNLADETVKHVRPGRVPGSPIPHVMASGARRVLLKQFPYSIIFYDREDELLVIAFAHTSRRPGYWRSRNAK
jgi:toxin ParE1/3/4